MKLKIQASALLGALESIRPVYSGRTTLPALSMVKLVAADRLTVSANNLDLFCAFNCDADISDPGEFAVSGLRLLNAAKSCGGEEIELEVREKSLHFKSGKSAMRMSGLAVEEIPEDTKCMPTSECAMAASELSQALSETLPFVSNDAARFTLQGVYFESSEAGLTLTATNGRTLSSRVIEVQSAGVTAIVPTAAAQLISKLCGEIRLGFSENSFLAETSEQKIVGKCVEGIYPNWRNSVPTVKEQTVRVFVDRKALLSALPFLSIGLADMQIVNLTIGKDAISLSAHADEIEGVMEVQATVTGKGFKTAFQVAYLSMCLNATPDTEVTLLFRDPMGPVLIERNGGVTVAMCMRVS